MSNLFFSTLVPSLRFLLFLFCQAFLVLDAMKFKSLSFFSLFSTFVVPFFHFISSLFITSFHFPSFLFAAFVVRVISPYLQKYLEYFFTHTHKFSLSLARSISHTFSERKRKQEGCVGSWALVTLSLSPSVMCNALHLTTHKESSLFSRHKVNDEKCTVVDSGSHYGV